LLPHVVTMMKESPTPLQQYVVVWRPIRQFVTMVKTSLTPLQLHTRHEMRSETDVTMVKTFLTPLQLYTVRASASPSACYNGEDISYPVATGSPLRVSDS